MTDCVFFDNMYSGFWRVGAKISWCNSKGEILTVSFLTTCYFLECVVGLLVLRLPFKKFYPPIEDERVYCGIPGFF